MQDDRSQTYEFIVVGSGAGGGTVAANLARAGHRVLVLEAGGPPPDPPDYEYAVPAFHTIASETPAMSWEFFVRHYADQAQQVRDSKYVPAREGVFYPRAGTLGGCTAHNAMILVCPSNRDWDRIAEETHDDSWRADRMREYFQRIENCRYRPIWRVVDRLIGWNPGRHGFAGWLTTDEADPTLAVHDRALLKILTRAVWSALFGSASLLARLRSVLKTWFDPNDWRGVQRGLEGVRMTPLTTDGGHRYSTRDRLLAVQRDCPNLEIRTNALVTRVLLDAERRAEGVEYLEGAHLYRADPQSAAADDGPRGVLRQVRATREVILAGGAFNTPQLLQLSGVGPAALLQEHGIEVRVDLPGVGVNMQDRYEVGVVARMKQPFRLLDGAVMRPPAPGEAPDKFLQEWIDTGHSIYTSNGAVVSILKKSDPGRPEPDLLIFGLVTNFRGYYPGYSIAVSEAHQYFTWAILKGYSENRAGRVAIRSRDPRDVPAIDFHYFHEGTTGGERDLQAVADAVEFVRRIMSRYAHLIEVEEVPGPQVRTRADLERFVRDEAWGHHASCTCKIGADDDPLAVLDSRFRVRGTRNLRVVDASIFPHIPGLFIVSAIYIAAEKASDVILADARANAAGAPPPGAVGPRAPARPTPVEGATS